MRQAPARAKLDYPYDAPASEGSVVEVAPGILWARMPMPMALDHINVYLLKDTTGWILVDTGLNTQASKQCWEHIAATHLAGLSIQGLICTHMHYDHAGNNHLFQGARYHLQDKEMAFATGRCMCHKVMRFPFDVQDVTAMVQRVYEDRTCFHDGDEEIAPGLSLHHVGGALSF